MEDKKERIKDLYYRDCISSNPYDTKTMLGDFNANIEKKEIFRSTIGEESLLYKVSPNNGIKVINFTAARDLIIKTIFFHFVIDKRQCNVLDVREYRGRIAASITF